MLICNDPLPSGCAETVCDIYHIQSNLLYACSEIITIAHVSNGIFWFYSWRNINITDVYHPMWYFMRRWYIRDLRKLLLLALKSCLFRSSVSVLGEYLHVVSQIPPPPVDRMTYACESNALPQFCLWGGGVKICKKSRETRVSQQEVWNRNLDMLIQSSSGLVNRAAVAGVGHFTINIWLSFYTTIMSLLFAWA